MVSANIRDVMFTSENSLAEAGFRTIAFDLRGHGRSAGKPVLIGHYEDLARDVDWVMKQFKGNPAFLFGHSLGAQLVLWTAQHFQLELTGLISSAAWLALAHEPPRWQVMVAKMGEPTGSRPAFFDRHRWRKTIA